ncbi:MAG: DNA/RNA helicase domain-containing protein [Armatimonadota bacterium]
MSVFGSVQVIVELQMPVGGERADIMLLGGTPTAPKGFIVELKQWSDAALTADPYEVLVPGIGQQRHPSLQALIYRGRLHFFHSRAEAFDLRAGVLAHNMPKRVKDELTDAFERMDFVTAETAPIYCEDDGPSFTATLAQHLLPTSLSPDEHARVAGAAYAQTCHLVDFLQHHAADIAERAQGALADAGLGFTLEQQAVIDLALEAARAGSQEAYLVQGGPGSGKTLVAVSILLQACQNSIPSVLALRNNRLQAVLRRCFDAVYPGASGLMMYFEPAQGTGIGTEGLHRSFDLVICDEAQRMESRIMPRVMGRAPVCVFFFDETQRLNPPEEGTATLFESTAEASGKRVVHRQLSSALRCRGGDAYHRWVEEVLRDPQALLVGAGPMDIWRDAYDFSVAPSIGALLGSLQGWRASASQPQVALVASFTESPGSPASTAAPENVRIGYPLESGLSLYKGSGAEVRWLMRPAEYVRFWMQGGSNRLDRVASIYGAQGFESDYVGVVWGRDLVIRDGQWVLGDPMACYDTIDGLVSRGRARRWCSDALELLRNRYRIFLTRGILGTFVFFEDDETRDYLTTG